MRILIAHNAYQHKGGEDMVVGSEIALLRAYGHEVAEYRRHNDEITGISNLALLGQTLWSARTTREVAKWVNDFKPDIIHAHNTFPLISPSLYCAATEANIPLVQTLHNFRLLCPQAIFLRDGKICEDCLGTLPWRGVVRGCYRHSKAQSAVVASMLTLHRLLGTYRDRINCYIALSEFSRKKFIEGGLPAEKIVVKSNFANIPAHSETERRGGLFVGRLSSEKGTSTLLELAEVMPDSRIKVIGSGSEEPGFRLKANFQMLGFLNREQILSYMRSSAYLLLPSICYEGFPMVLVEAYACGLPVIASRIGSLAELVVDGKTGLLFEPGSARDLAEKVRWAESNPGVMAVMGENARQEYEEKYTAKRNLTTLMEIYSKAVMLMDTSSSL